MRERKKRNPKRNANYLPGHQGKAFQQELSDLIDRLAQTEGFAGAYLKSECFSKYADHTTVPPKERRAAAIAKWLATEERNRKTNMRLLIGDADFGWSKPSGENRSDSDRLIAKAREIICAVLGPLKYPDVFVGSSHTNGASTRIRRGSDAALRKLAGQAHVSTQTLGHWCAASQDTVLRHQELEVKEESVMFTVPKATEIDRVACKEPEINMFLQRACGSHIRRQLRKHGIDLNDQTINQRLAKDALDLGLATIDLSAASDSITKQLVIELLPFEWYSLLDDLRVHAVDIDGTVHYPEMFSSMGNGFTFELESLIFYALARAVAWANGTKGIISVYGDDIIVPSVIAPRLARVFNWFGFKVNTKKSHWSGQFRESCGKHYYRSQDVTPFYIRGPVSCKTDIIRLLNRLLQWDGKYLKCITHPDILSFHKKWSSAIPHYLHGGQDPEMDTSLVTGDEPRKRLMRKAVPLDFDQEIGLIWWLNERDADKRGTPVVTNAVAFPWEAKHDWGTEPLVCEPAEEGRYFVGSQPSWTVRTPWDPYLLLRV